MTTALCAALKILGISSYHFSEISRNKNNKHFELWLEAVQAKYDGIGKPWKGEDFDRILWNYDVSIPVLLLRIGGGNKLVSAYDVVHRSLSHQYFLASCATDTDTECI